MTIYALGPELDRFLSGATVVRVLRFPGAITIELDGAPTRYWHVLHHTHEPDLVATRGELVPASLGSAEMEAAAGQRIAGVRALGMERVLLARLASGGDWGERADLLMRIDLTPGGKPLSLFAADTERLLAAVGDSRARGTLTPFETRKQKPISILTLPEAAPEELRTAFTAVSSPAWYADEAQKRMRLEHVGSVLADRVGGLDPLVGQAVSEAAEGDIDRIWALLGEIGRRLSAGPWDWRVYRFFTRRDGFALYPIELPIEVPNDHAVDCLDALDRFGRDAAIPSYFNHLRSRAAAAARRDMKRLERLRNNLAGDLADAARSEEFRHFGNLLVTHRQLLRRGMKSFTVRDFSGEREVTIPLDPARPIEANIRSYFVKAKKGEKGLLIIRNRKREVERSIADQQTLVSRVEQMTEPSEIIAFIPREKTLRAPRRGASPEEQFRRFPIDDRHTVFVGRTDKENDILTHHFASTQDLWFHAQGVSGSHVILKGAHRSTPAAVIEKAAAIAAYFSKARHSATVPVIYAEKRYVRKPRKAKPGTAICLRGKTIFVSPEIPREQKPR
jgi:predicted ribosome quality control (RQC) complex YloA/Tae2 family protein